MSVREKDDPTSVLSDPSLPSTTPNLRPVHHFRPHEESGISFGQPSSRPVCRPQCLFVVRQANSPTRIIFSIATAMSLSHGELRPRVERLAAHSPGFLKRLPRNRCTTRQAAIGVTLIEGNRRLAAVKLLLDADLRNKLRATDLPTISAERRSEIAALPIIITNYHTQRFLALSRIQAC